MATQTVEQEAAVEVESTGLPSMRAETPERITQIVAELERIKDTARDYVVPASGMRVVSDFVGEPEQEATPPRLVVDHGDVAGATAYGINPVAHAQIAAKLDIPAKYYKRMLASQPALLAENANTWLRNDSRKFLMRTIDGNVRAILGNGFRPMDGGDLFWSSYDTIKEVGAQITRMDLSETRFYMRALHPEYEERIEHIRSAPRGTRNVGGFDDADYVIPGIMLSTSDVGLGSLRGELFIYRRTCGNGQVGDDVFTRIHSGERLKEGYLTRPTIEKMNEVVWMQVQDAIRAAFDPQRFHQMVVDLGLATGKVIEEPTAAVEAVANHYGITDDRKQRILDELITGGEGSTVFGLIQAITAVGREEQNYDNGVALERVGGALLKDADRVLAPVIVRR